MSYPRFALVAVLTLVSVPTAWGQPHAEPILHSVKIGQRDCRLIECPTGRFILVAAGSTGHGMNRWLICGRKDGARPGGNRRNHDGEPGAVRNTS